MAHMAFSTAFHIALPASVLHRIPIPQDVGPANLKSLQFGLGVVIGLYGVKIILHPVFLPGVHIVLELSLIARISPYSALDYVDELILII